MSEHKIQLNWNKNNSIFEYDKYDRTHNIQFNGGQAITSSATKEFLGNDSHANPEELMAASLASCHMLTFLAIAAKKKLQVENYEDNPTAVLDKGASGRLEITKIILRPKVQFETGTSMDIETLNKLHESAHRNCFIGNSISSDVTIEPILA
ncbi:MAG: OsmC family protein [Leptospiraceae bacterium]|nr:OsmC family protein [Leptospiraceae bacterium]